MRFFAASAVAAAPCVTAPGVVLPDGVGAARGLAGGSGKAKGLIAFASNRTRNGKSDLWLMNGDGSHQRQLTHNRGLNDFPSWSPDGAKLVFTSARDDPRVGLGHVYVIGVNGTGQRRLTNTRHNDGGPDWSPDGKRIIFYSDRAGV